MPSKNKQPGRRSKRKSGGASPSHHPHPPRPMTAAARVRNDAPRFFDRMVTPGTTRGRKSADRPDDEALLHSEPSPRAQRGSPSRGRKTVEAHGR